MDTCSFLGCLIKFFFSESNDVLEVIVWSIADLKKKQFLIVVQFIMKFSSVPWKTIGIQIATNVKCEFENFQVQS
jgi:hypothetical protein